MKHSDMTGKRFGRWTVIAPGNKRTSSGCLKWVCRCDCGTIREVDGTALRSGKSLSCGCYHSDRVKEVHTTHGATKVGARERLYPVWHNMMDRCYKPEASSYHSYGARGIVVCDEWHDYERFKEWAFSSGYDPNAEAFKCMLDRIDNNGDYSPDNCRWVDSKTQNNNRRTCRYITWKGETHSVTEWNERLNLPKGLLIQRLNYGWSMDRAATEPPRVTARKI